MRQYLRELGAGDGREHTVRKTRFGEIARGLSLGAAYAFDAQSYGRFEPLQALADTALALGHQFGPLLRVEKLAFALVSDDRFAGGVPLCQLLDGGPVGRVADQEAEFLNRGQLIRDSLEAGEEKVPDREMGTHRLTEQRTNGIR
jgi:hypothetical protein